MKQLALRRLTRQSCVMCLALLIGCDGTQTANSNKPPIPPASVAATQPGAQVAAEAAAPPPPLLAESRKWSREQAAEQLSDAAAAISAAVRLIELAEPESRYAQGEWPVERVNRLRLLPIGDSEYVFGVADESNAKLLAQAMRIAVDGSVKAIAVEEMPDARVYVSPDRDLFPALLIGKRQVRMLSDIESEALTIESPDNLRFDLHEKDEIASVLLMLDGAGGAVEAARYRWDPYELTFIGPACDKLPDPPGGKFQLDLKRCAALTPMGGELLPPPKIDDNRPAAEKEGPIY